MDNTNIDEGNIEISESVIVTFVEKVVGEIKEVSLSRKKKSIKVSNLDDGRKIDLSVEVDYGTNIPEIIKKMQKRLKETVEVMTGVSIKAINVVVDGLNIDKLIEK